MGSRSGTVGEGREEPAGESVPLRRSSRAAGLQASRPHSPRRPARARPSSLQERTTATMVAAEATGAVPRGGAGRGRGRRGRTGHVGGRRAGDPSGRPSPVAGYPDALRLGRCSALPSPCPAGVPRKARKGGEIWPPGQPPTPSSERIYRVGERVHSPTSRSRFPRGGSRDRYPSGRGPWRPRRGCPGGRAGACTRSPSPAYQADLGRVGSCPSLTFLDCGGEIEDESSRAQQVLRKRQLVGRR